MAIIIDFFYKLRELNLFHETNTVDQVDAQILRDQILSTRVYLVLLITSLFVFLLFLSVSMKPVSVTVTSPSLDMYRELQLAYPTTLSCPCKNMSISVGEFLSITPIYHQVRFFS